MVFVYNFVLIILSVILLPVILILFHVQPKFKAGWKEKLGFYKFDTKGKKSTIFHAVSVGETNAIKDLLRRYREKHPDEIIIVTTTTKTGQEIAQNSFKNIANHITYFPYDFFFSVLAFFKTFNPEKIIIAETEIWPCFVTLAKMKGIKVYTINGRISPHSFEGYKKIRLFLAPILNRYEKIFMQTMDDAERMVKMGAKADKIEVMGNLKFDINANITQEEVQRYKDELKINDYKLFIAASTHKGEDEIAIDSFKSLKVQHREAKLLLVPRHPQRFEEVCALLNKSNMRWGKRSQNDNFAEKDIILLDTMGELAKLYSICYLAFIGGSFSDTGGHNPLEANIWGKPVLSGPCVFNFKDVYKIITDNKCAVIVNSEDDLTKELKAFYDNTEKYLEYCNNAIKVFDGNKGAINFVLERV